MKNTSLNIYIKEGKKLAFICDDSTESIQKYNQIDYKDIQRIIVSDLKQELLDEVDVIIYPSNLIAIKDYNLTKHTILNYNDLEFESPAYEEYLDEVNSSKNNKRDIGKLVQRISILFVVFFVGYGFATMIPVYNLKEFVSVIPSEFYIMLAVGFFSLKQDTPLL